MGGEGRTPLEVPAVLQLGDYDLAVRCLELIRSRLRSILPAGVRYRVELIALCHHHSSNVYPAFGLFGVERWEELEEADTRINAWVADLGLDRLVAESESIVAPSWADLRARWHSRTAT